MIWGWVKTLYPCSSHQNSWYMDVHSTKKAISLSITICTSSTAQGGGGSFKNRKPIGEACCCGAKMAERTHWWIERWLCVSAFLSAVARTKQAAATPWGRHVGGMGRVTFLHVFLYFWRHDGARQHSGSRRFLSAVARTKLPRHREADTSEGWVTLNFFMFFCTIIIPLHASCLSNPVSTLMVGTCPLDESISVVLHGGFINMFNMLVLWCYDSHPMNDV